MTQIQKIQNMGIAVPRMAVPILLWGMIMRIKAYAKINLALDITGRREDGYHLLDMVMHTISLCDILTLRQGGDGLSVTCGRTDVPCGEENTVYRAAEAFFRVIFRSRSKSGFPPRQVWPVEAQMRPLLCMRSIGCTARNCRSKRSVKSALRLAQMCLSACGAVPRGSRGLESG